MTLVAAVDLAGLIGRGDALPWRLPADLRHFRAITTGHPVVMGRRTHASIGRPLPKRTNVVVSRDAGFCAEGCACFASIDAALAHARGIDPVVHVIGGAEVYAATLPYADALEITVIGARFEGDTWFPAVVRDAWRVDSREAHAIDEENRWPFAFVRLVRVAPDAVGGAALDWSTLAP